MKTEPDVRKDTGGRGGRRRTGRTEKDKQVVVLYLPSAMFVYAPSLSRLSSYSYLRFSKAAGVGRFTRRVLPSAVAGPAKTALLSPLRRRARVRDRNARAGALACFCDSVGEGHSQKKDARFARDLMSKTIMMMGSR